MMKPEESIQIFVPLKVRKQNGRPKIMPPATYLPSEDRSQDPHILRAIGRAFAAMCRSEPPRAMRSSSACRRRGWMPGIAVPRPATGGGAS